MLRKVALFLISASMGLPLLAQGGLRYTIQVRKFENQAGWRAQWDLGDAWGAVLTDSLQQTGNFIVLAEQDMRVEAMDEQDFASSGRTAGGNKAPETGQMTPAQMIIKGAITSFDDGTGGGSTGASYKGVGVRFGGKKARIGGVVYVVDTTTAQVLASHKFEAEVKAGSVRLSVSKHGFHGDVGGFKKTPAGKVMEKACDDVSKFLVSQLGSTVQWSGTVVKGGSDRIIINRGTREGVSVGQVFRLGKTEEIRDPDTGELLDQDFVMSGKLEITSVKEKICYGKLIDGNPPKKGDAVFP